MATKGRTRQWGAEDSEPTYRAPNPRCSAIVVRIGADTLAHYRGATGTSFSGMVWNKTRRALLAGEHVTGHFQPAGSDVATPGLLWWSADGGALVELIGGTEGWPTDRGEPHHVIYGETREGDSFTLPKGWVKSVAFGDEVTRFKSSMLVLGEHVAPERRWPRSIYSTANLSEWRADTGLDFSYPNRRKRPHHFRLDCQPPTRDEVDVSGARLSFVGDAETQVGYAAEWSISTRQKVIANTDEPLTIAEHDRLYGLPLRTFTAFVADRPDGLTHEVMVDPVGKERVEVWRAGTAVEAREWGSGLDYVFRADARTGLRRGYPAVVGSA
jgi:hypothetical protein